jgi:3-oxoacyl-[acyl-carrier protein] reductase
MSGIKGTSVLARRTAVVTGGSRGIGAAIVERLASDGANVVFSYSRDADAAAALVADLADAPGAVRAVRAELHDPDSLVELFDRVDDDRGGVDIVVHNAAVENAVPLIVDTTDDDYRQVIDGNVHGGFVIVREACRRLADHGRLITISSQDTAVAAPGNALYAASKTALEQFTAVAAKELGPRGITANVVSPGATDTTRLRSLRSDSELLGAAAAAALGRLGTPHDIAAVVAFLAGPDGAWVTGQNIRVTGGVL